MKTVMMTPPPMSNGGAAGVNTAAVESAVDAYATRVLEMMSPPEAFVDTSLGPYVTSLLRCAEIQDKDELTSFSEFDSLLELLEDQCNMKSEVATEALKTIANAVCTGVVPADGGNGSPASIGVTLFARGGLDNFQMLKTTLPEDDVSGSGCHAGIDPYTPLPAGGPSPLKPDNLIPVDLLGALDDPSPRSYRSGRPDVIEEQTKAEEEPEPASTNEEAFPPLGAPVTSAPKKGRGKKSSKAHSDKDLKAHSDKDLAASLFRPARPRQNSIEKEDSPMMKPAIPPGARPMAAGNNMYFQQQWNSSVEILLSMNPELSEEAAAEAGLMANTDFNVAQYIVDSAMTAPPVCRHMLHEGCYRSDCQFSHDVDGHTCLFWLRGRCGKGDGCKFLHGFNPKILNDVPVQLTTSASSTTAPVPINPGTGASHQGFSNNPYSTFQPMPLPTSDGFSGFSLPSSGFDANGYETSRLGSSWQSPSIADTSASNSYSSGDSRSGAAVSFANIASRGYDRAKFSPVPDGNGTSSSATIPTVRIPQDLWNPNENRDASVFHIPDPIERYMKVSEGFRRRDVVDLHFQSIKTFPVVLSSLLPRKLSELGEVWIVTGTGHHVGTKTHQKGGGALERAVMAWLLDAGYNFCKGRDRNGLGGAILVKR